VAYLSSLIRREVHQLLGKNCSPSQYCLKTPCVNLYEVVRTLCAQLWSVFRPNQTWSVSTTEAEGRREQTQHGVMPRLAGAEGWRNDDLYCDGRSVPSAMTYCTAWGRRRVYCPGPYCNGCPEGSPIPSVSGDELAQLRFYVNSSCWCIEIVLKQPPSLKSGTAWWASTLGYLCSVSLVSTEEKNCSNPSQNASRRSEYSVMHVTKRIKLTEMSSSNIWTEISWELNVELKLVQKVPYFSYDKTNVNPYLFSI